MKQRKFEVGMQYRMLANRRQGHFWATCVSRTDKTATFEANLAGSAWYKPKFTLRMPRNGDKVLFDDAPEEVMRTNIGSNHFPYGITAFASESREPKKGECA